MLDDKAAITVLTPPESDLMLNAAASTSEKVANNTIASDPTYQSTVRERASQTIRASKKTSTPMPRPPSIHSAGMKREYGRITEHTSRATPMYCQTPSSQRYPTTFNSRRNNWLNSAPVSR